MAKENTNEEKVYCFHLIAGEIVFATPPESPDQEPQSSVMRLNGIIETTDGNITAAHIGKSQQILQMHFRTRVPDATIQVLDVFVYGFTPLGYMTQTQFKAPPVGMVMQQVPDTVGDKAFAN